jgi:hypothetical protein
MRKKRCTVCQGTGQGEYCENCGVKNGLSFQVSEELKAAWRDQERINTAIHKRVLLDEAQKIDHLMDMWRIGQSKETGKGYSHLYLKT